LTRRLIYAQTIEPTNVAGFNQFYDDFEAASTWNYGIGIDQKFSETWFAGIQYMHRDLEVPFTAIDPMGFTEVIEDDWQEKIGSAFLYWAPRKWLALGLEYYYEDFFHQQWEGPQGIRNLTTHRLTPTLHFFHSSGIIVKFQAGYVDQEGDFGSNLFGFARDSDQFPVVDCSLSYRLPKRHGILRLEVKNLFDERFHFLDTDPGNPRFLPEQQVIGSFTVAF
jgi:outer membrane receptor protein involved in Fe transport